VVVQGDKMLVVAVARRADCGRFCLSLPLLVEAGEILLIRVPDHIRISLRQGSRPPACARPKILTWDRTLPGSKIAFAIRMVRLKVLRALTQSPLMVGGCPRG
jgi:hypothetical protein